MANCFCGSGHCPCVFGDCIVPNIFDRSRRVVGLAFYLRGACSSNFRSSLQKRHSGLAYIHSRVVPPASNQLLGNPLLFGVILLALVIGVVLVAEGIIEIVLFFVLREHRHVAWILIDGVVTLLLGIVACAHWLPASLDLVQSLVGISFISSGIPVCCSALHFASCSKQRLQLREHEAIRPRELASVGVSLRNYK